MVHMLTDAHNILQELWMPYFDNPTANITTHSLQHLSRNGITICLAWTPRHMGSYMGNQEARQSARENTPSPPSSSAVVPETPTCNWMLGARYAR